MKKITKMVEQVIGYKAADGTVFTSELDCKAYENSARAVMAKAKDELVVFHTDAESLFGCETMTSSDYLVEFYRIKNAHDLTVLNQYVSSLEYAESNKNLVPVDAIGNVVGVSYSYDSEYACYIGTIGEYCNRLAERYDTLMPKEE